MVERLGDPPKVVQHIHIHDQVRPVCMDERMRHHAVPLFIVMHQVRVVLQLVEVLAVIQGHGRNTDRKEEDEEGYGQGVGLRFEVSGSGFEVWKETDPSELLLSQEALRRHSSVYI